MPASLTAVARRYLFVRETLGPNRGYWVQFFQRRSGGDAGEAWCADFVNHVLDVAYMGQAPLAVHRATSAQLDEAKFKGWVRPTPAPDDLYFYVNDAGRAHHVGIVTSVAPLIGIAGNTSEDGLSDNGTGVYEHRIPSSHVVFARLPT